MYLVVEYVVVPHEDIPNYNWVKAKCNSRVMEGYYLVDEIQCDTDLEQYMFMAKLQGKEPIIYDSRTQERII